MNNFFALAILAALFICARPAAAGDALEAGFGRRSLVTERAGVSLGGYGGRGLLPVVTGVHDPVFAKAMVLRTPGRAIALVTVDLIGVQRTMLDALREHPLPARVGLRADDVIICASHTHASYGSLARPTGAPGLDALFFVCCGPFRREFFDEVVEKVRGALTDAWDDLRPARLGVGAEDVPGLAHNRGRSGAPVDPEIGVVKVTDLDGAVRGLVVNFAGHPVFLGADNFQVSAEYPGAMQRALEERFPGATAMFTQGAEGDVTANGAGDSDDAFARLEATGRRLADVVARIQERIEVRADVAIDARTRALEMPRPSGARDRLKSLGGVSRSVFCEAVLGDTLLMGIPGEPCCRIGLDLKAG
ncbi:MAG TPA: neutral/alkaline non-lysosomal ceramidase N-terminal domain-containing protein, partial [Planctomycetota bacterium]|nr:neutral/alkaline non-lysosomal ceramidase N-terminal domain-containing protein [Planctomycetota bacterium]